MRCRLTPSFAGLVPGSPAASAAARGSSAKKNTRCEVMLRRELWRRGLRYRLHCAELPGHPDIAFPARRVVVFCDGDFWHGRHLQSRLSKLRRGHNSKYWVAKVTRNVERDRQNTRCLEEMGWVVLRFWETDVLRDSSNIADRIATVVGLVSQLPRSASRFLKPSNRSRAVKGRSILT